MFYERKDNFLRFFDLFQPDLFHAGGDEVNLNCWKQTKEVSDYTKQKFGGVSNKQFFDLWEDFLVVSFFYRMMNHVSIVCGVQ